MQPVRLQHRLAARPAGAAGLHRRGRAVKLRDTAALLRLAWPLLRAIRSGDDERVREVVRRIDAVHNRAGWL